MQPNERPDRPITTGTIHISPSTYIAEIMRRWVSRRWWIAAVPVAAFTVAGAWNPAFFFVALMWLFLIFPPVLMTVYFHYGLHPEIQRVIHPHRVTINSDSLVIEFEETDGTTTPPPRTVGMERLTAVTSSRRTIVLEIDNSCHDIVIIPLVAADAATIGAIARLFF